MLHWWDHTDDRIRDTQLSSSVYDGVMWDIEFLAVRKLAYVGTDRVKLRRMVLRFGTTEQMSYIEVTR
jgi:hypothetical protein